MKSKVIMAPKALKIYEQLKKSKYKSDQMLVRSINRKIELLKENSHQGQPIAKKKIPAEYIITYEAKNLYRLEISQFWRMIYTIRGSELEIIALIVDITDHRSYNKTFCYKS